MLRWALLAFALGVLLAAVWGVVIEPRLIDVEEEVAVLPGLPPAWEGQRVALIADLQLGMWLANTDTIERIVARIVEERPAMVLIAGDFLYQPARPEPGGEIAAAADLLRPLTAANIPTYAVLGNHDYAAAPEEFASGPEPLASDLRTALEEIGVEVLENEAVPVTPPGQGGGESLYLVGIGAHLPDDDRPVAAVSQVPAGAPRLIVMHNPASFEPLPAGSAPVALAGHTHGGQIRVPFAPELAPARLLKEWPQYASGWIEGYGQAGNRLYINRGIGFSLIPVRFGSPPELTLLELTGADR